LREIRRGVWQTQQQLADVAAEHHALHTRLDRVDAKIDAFEEQRPPPLWNQVDVTPAKTLGTVAEALRAVFPDDTAFSDALEYGIALFRGCAQGPLFAAVDSQELRGLVEGDRLPLPPPEVSEGYIAAGEEISYWMLGLGDRLLLEDLGRRLNRPLAADSRLLDFGSSSGRVLRHFVTAYPEMQLFGVDLGRHSVEWARQHLSPAVTVALGTTIPHLPFPDAFFDCIYAGSVFTHIADFEEAWLLELSRVLSPTGFAVLTFHPARTWSDVGRSLDHPLRGEFERRPYRLDPGAIEPVGIDIFNGPMPADRTVLTMTDWPVNYPNAPQVFHSEAWIRERWGQLFRLEFIVERAHGEHQDAGVLTASRYPPRITGQSGSFPTDTGHTPS
jgi:SAM-dependent methyltransferase